MTLKPAKLSNQSTGDHMPESWKDTNINAGALVAFVAMITTVVTFVIGVQWYIDARILAHVAPIQMELKEFKLEIRQHLSTADSSRNRQYGEILSRIDRLSED